MFKKLFLRMFLNMMGNKENLFHPLVWINGSPIIGSGTYIGGFSEINAKRSEVKIGNNCDIASFVSINVADSHFRCIGLTDKIECKSISIGDNVFIGSHSVILGGASIGSNSVIAAGSVVRSEDIPPFSLVYGSPLKVKKGYYKKEWERLHVK